MHKALSIGVVAALGLGTQAFAADGSSLSYDYLEGNYVTADVDGLHGSDPDGFGVNGSLAFTPMVHGFVDYNNLDLRGTTVQTWELGVGLNHSINPMFDLVGRVGYIKTQVEGPLSGDDGYGLQAGVRGRLAERWKRP